MFSIIILEGIIDIHKKDVIMINLKIMEYHINLAVVKIYIMKSNIERNTYQPILVMQDIMNTIYRIQDLHQVADGIMILIHPMMWNLMEGTRHRHWEVEVQDHTNVLHLQSTTTITLHLNMFLVKTHSKGSPFWRN